MQSSGRFCQEIDWLEYFAGTGNLSSVMVSAQYRVAKFDVLFNKQPPHRSSNFMDLTHASGYAFLASLIEMIPFCCDVSRNGDWTN